MALTKLRLGQIDLRDLESSELASSNSIGNALSNLATVGATSNTLMGTVSGNVSVAVDTLQDNVDTQSSSLGTISDNVDSDASTFAAYATYANSTFTTQTYVDGEVANLVASAGSDLDTLDELASALNDDANAATTLTTTIGTVSGNVTTYSTDLDGVSSNLDTYATYANSQLGGGGTGTFAANGESVSNTTVFFEGGAGFGVTTNTTSQTVTLSMEMSNASTQEISMNGASNVITLTKGAANVNMLLVFYNGLAQRPSEYTVSGTTLTLSNTKPIIAGSNVEVRHFDFFPVTGVAAGGGGSSASYMIGESTGVTMGGRYYDGSFNYRNTVQHFSLTSSSPSSGPATLSAGEQSVAAGGSSTDAYKFDGSTSTNSERFPFAAFTPRISVGSATTGGWGSVWHNDSKALNPRNQWSFASDASSSPITLTAPGNISMASGESGYRLGSGIYKIPFASDSPSDTGATTVFKHGSGTGLNSPTHGYGAGGNNSEAPYSAQDTITKFSFASDGNSTDVGELNNAFGGSANHSTASEGFLSGGGAIVSAGGSSTIQKFSFTSDTSGVAGGVGSLSSPVEVIGQGTQV